MSGEKKTAETKFTREIVFSPAYDKRNTNPSKDYGIGSLSFSFVLRGKKGAISIRFGTDIFLPETIKEYMSGKAVGYNGIPIPATDLRDVNYPIKAWSIDRHLLKPKYKWESRTSCTFTGKGYCYRDGSCCLADDLKLTDKLLREGHEAVWKVAEEMYERWCEPAPTPSKEAKA